MSWSFSNDKPIFQQLVDIITLKIISGEYPTGGKLDAVRELAVTAGVNPNTMQRALAVLSLFLLLKSSTSRAVRFTPLSALEIRI